MTNNFERSVSAVRKAIVNRIRNSDRVSSVDLSTVASGVEGSARGAVIRAAFNRLVEERVISRTKDQVRNPRTRSLVSVYKRVGRVERPTTERKTERKVERNTERRAAPRSTEVREESRTTRRAKR